MKFIVDDNIIVRGEVCAAGSKMLYNFRPPFQAEAVDRAIGLGWELVGRVDIGEFAMDGSGYGCYKGPIPNPLDARRCGSAAAAAVLRKEADAALIVDCGGDGLRLAALSGCVAYRPSYGRISRYGVIANVSSCEQISGVGVNVINACTLANDAGGRDSKDATSLEPDGYPLTVPESVRGYHVGVMGELPEEVFRRLRAAGAAVSYVQPLAMDWMVLGADVYMVLAAAEGCNNISRFDGVKYGYRAEEYSNMEELYVNSRSQGLGREAKLQAIMGSYFLSKGYYETYYVRAMQIRAHIRQQYFDLLKNYHALVSWASHGIAYPIGSDPAKLVRADRGLTAPASLACLPAVTIPWRDNAKLPRAMQITTETHRDIAALSVAAVLEGGR